MKDDDKSMYADNNIPGRFEIFGFPPKTDSEKKLKFTRWSISTPQSSSD